MARQDSPSHHQDRFMLRLTTDGMRDRLKLAAEQNGRSLNAEINIRLEASFEFGSASLSAVVASAIKGHVDAEVQRRLKAIASQIGGAA